MPLGPLQALLVDSLQCSAVLIGSFGKSQGVNVVNKASLKYQDGQGVAHLNEIGRVKEEENWQ